MTKIEELREKANRLPLLPGVYIMLDASGEVIYVGKAKALKNRVTSYFRGDHLPKVAAMVSHVNDFNVIIAETEFEALVLETRSSSATSRITTSSSRTIRAIRSCVLTGGSRTRALRSQTARTRTGQNTLAPTAAGDRR